jgi:hypothetical protein
LPVPWQFRLRATKHVNRSWWGHVSIPASAANKDRPRGLDIPYCCLTVNYLPRPARLTVDAPLFNPICTLAHAFPLTGLDYSQENAWGDKTTKGFSNFGKTGTGPTCKEGIHGPVPRLIALPDINPPLCSPVHLQPLVVWICMLQCLVGTSALYNFIHLHIVQYNKCSAHYL